MLPARALATPRLTLRPSALVDAERFFEIQSDWNVVHNLRAAAWPVTLDGLSAWLAGAHQEWMGGTAYRFTILLGSRVIGCADVDEIAAGRGDLGYWLAHEAWGRGFATEAGAAVRDFAFTTVGLAGLDSGHAADNQASGKVLTKLGFLRCGETRLWSNPRQDEIVQMRYRLDRGVLNNLRSDGFV